MEKKKLSKRFSSIRSVFGVWRAGKSFFRKLNLSSGFKSSWSSGFTLIELLVVFAMIAAMTSLLFILINPFKQIQKGQDAKREQDLKQINLALDTYFNDKNCYPASISFGGSFSPYMQKVPQDPTFSGGGSDYRYINDGSTCPQWNVLFAKISYKPASSVSCPLEQITNCVPSNYASSGYNYCVLSGKVDCASIRASSL